MEPDNADERTGQVCLLLHVFLCVLCVKCCMSLLLLLFVTHVHSCCVVICDAECSNLCAMTACCCCHFCCCISLVSQSCCLWRVNLTCLRAASRDALVWWWWLPLHAGALMTFVTIPMFGSLFFSSSSSCSYVTLVAFRLRACVFGCFSF